jgi:hypothetical protein
VHEQLPEPPALQLGGLRLERLGERLGGQGALVTSRAPSVGRLPWTTTE